VIGGVSSFLGYEARIQGTVRKKIYSRTSIGEEKVWQFLI
jgi:hypothetical protein